MHLRRLHSIVYIVILSFLPALRMIFLSDVFDILACGWVVLCMLLKRVHKWLRCCSHVADLCKSFFTICCDHAFTLCYYCNILCGILLEIACPEILHRSSCFRSHIYYIYSWLCIVYFFTWSSKSLLLCGGRG